MIELNEIYWGDHAEVMKNIPSGSIDLIKTDLPFGTTKAKWDKPVNLPLMWEQYCRIIKPNGAILLNAQTPYNIVLGASNLKMLRYEWIWEKTSATGHLNAKKMPMKAHENILVFYKKLPTYNPIKTFGHVRKTAHKRIELNSELYNNNTSATLYDSTERYPRSVLKFKSDKQTSNLHSTQKPLELEKYFIQTYSNEGDTVLDSCAGSGQVGVACIELNRNYILIEIDKEKHLKCKSRLELLKAA